MKKFSNPSIELVLPFYGVLSEIESSVGSVLGQLDPEWSLLVIDDCSPDLRAGTWLNSLGDQRIRYMRNSENLGISGNFQRCLDNSLADYVVFIGQDDLLLNNYISQAKKLVNAFPKAAVIQTGVETIDSSGKPKLGFVDLIKKMIFPKGPYPKEIEGEKLASSLSMGNWAYFPSLIWKSSTIKNIGFDANLNVVLDLDLLFEVITRKQKMIIDNKTVFQYRRHHKSFSSITATSGRRFEEEAFVYSKFAKKFADLGWKKSAKLSLLRPTSRLNALSNIPKALVTSNYKGLQALIKHTFK